MIYQLKDTPMPDAKTKYLNLKTEIAKLGQTKNSLIRDDITIIAVSKTHPAQAIIPFIEAGIKDFGENKVQEAIQKWQNLKLQYPSIRLHGLGVLQSNKVKDALTIFDVIHSIDRPKLLPILRSEISENHLPTKLFLQINITDEPQKSGAPLNQADEFIESAIKQYQLPVIGLMGIAKFDEPAAPYFALLKKLNDKHHLPFLSMGMSADYEDAIRFGASHIRIGSHLFGARQQ